MKSGENVKRGVAGIGRGGPCRTKGAREEMGDVKRNSRRLGKWVCCILQVAGKCETGGKVGYGGGQVVGVEGVRGSEALRRYAVQARAWQGAADTYI
jgi:hypothetical protein